MMKKVIAFILISTFMVGCQRNISSIEFYPAETTTKETERETETQAEEFYLKYSIDKENYITLNVIDASNEGKLVASDVTEFNIKIPKNANLSDYCLYKDELFYTYNFAFYEIEQYYIENIKVEHTKDYYTRVMSYNYYTGETKCIYEDETPGVAISELSVEGGVATWFKYYVTDSTHIYGDSLVDDDIKGGGHVIDIFDLETGSLMTVKESEENGYFQHLTRHPYLISMIFDDGVYKYDIKNEKNSKILNNPNSYMFYYGDEGFALANFTVEYTDIDLYDYDGKLLCSFRTNAVGVSNVMINGGYVVIEANDIDWKSILLVHDMKQLTTHKLGYNAGGGSVVSSGYRVYMPDYGNSGIRIFDSITGLASSNYYGEGQLELKYSYTGGVYAKINTNEAVMVENDNRIIEFIVFNE